MSKICPACGNVLNDGASFCGRCGTNVGTVQSAQQETNYYSQYPQYQGAPQYSQPAVQYEQPSLQKNNRLPIIIAAVLGLFVVILLVFILSGGLKDKLLVKVPDVVEIKYSDAAEKLNKAKLRGIITDKVEDNKVSKDFVAEQNPEAKITTVKGGRVELVVSAGKAKKYVPLMTDYSYGYASDLLEKSGFTVEKIEKENPGYAPDTVYDQSIQEGMQDGGETVKLYVTPKNTSTEAADVKVPQLSGKTVDSAKAELEKLGLYLAVSGSEYSSSVDRNKILSQEYAANSAVKKGSTVFVKISLGKQMSFVPDAVYRTAEKAEKLSEEAGLKVTVEHEQSREIAKDTVIRQSLADGEAVDKNTEIVLTVSDGYEVEVPDVRDKKEKDAIQALYDAELSVDIVYASSNTMSKGFVLTQNVDPGEKVQIGTTVTIIVINKKDKGENPVPVENFGKSDSDGNDILTEEATEKITSQKPVTTTKATTTTTTTTKPASEDWRDASVKALNDFISQFGASGGEGVNEKKFAFCYIDGDNIPELVISNGTFNMAVAEIFVFSGGKYVDMGAFGSGSGTLYYLPKTGKILSSNVHLSIMSSRLSVLKNGKIEDIYSSSMATKTNGETDYYVNEKPVSESEYKAADKKNMPDNEEYVELFSEGKNVYTLNSDNIGKIKNITLK